MYTYYSPELNLIYHMYMYTMLYTIVLVVYVFFVRR